MIQTTPTRAVSIVFAVLGKPEPAGSKSSFVPTNRRTGQPYRGPGGRIIVNTVDANPKAKGWQKLVADTAENYRPDELLDGPLRLTLSFFRKRPEGHFNSKGELNKEGLAHPCPATRPDVLKLARGVEDALTGIIWTDDSRVVREVLSKDWSDVESVVIEIETL
jgi:Holliday junction resolvase RusA-like endonuclease